MYNRYNQIIQNNKQHRTAAGLRIGVVDKEYLGLNTLLAQYIGAKMKAEFSVQQNSLLIREALLVTERKIFEAEKPSMSADILQDREAYFVEKQNQLRADSEEFKAAVEARQKKYILGFDGLVGMSLKQLLREENLDLIIDASAVMLHNPNTVGEYTQRTIEIMDQNFRLLKTISYRWSRIVAAERSEFSDKPRFGKGPG